MVTYSYIYIPVVGHRYFFLQNGYVFIVRGHVSFYSVHLVKGLFSHLGGEMFYEMEKS